MKKFLFLCVLATMLSTSLWVEAHTAYTADSGLIPSDLPPKSAFTEIERSLVGEEQCTAPTSLKTLRVTSTSADLMWETYDEALSFHLKVSTAPLSNPLSDTPNVLDTTTYGKVYGLAGLTPATTYYFYVAATCDEGSESPWSQAGTFTTLCPPVTSLPYACNFENTSDFGTCWAKGIQKAGTWTSEPAATTYVNTNSQVFHEGGKALMLIGYYSGADQQNTLSIQAWTATPEINVANFDTKQVRFQTYSPDLGARLSVGVMSDPNDLATFEELAVYSFTTSNTWNELVVPFNTVLDPAAKHVAFKVDGLDLNTRFQVYVDEVIVEDAPVCPNAQMLNAENLTPSSASISWLGAADSWDIKVSTTTLNDPDSEQCDVLDSNVSAPPVLLNNLSASVQYYIYVRPNCVAGSGQWVNYSFTTPEHRATPPYSCDFSDETENLQWRYVQAGQTNYWMIGSDPGNGDTEALYITNDGSSNGYLKNSSSISYAYRSVSLQSGEYNISFDWKNLGEAGWDFLSVYLLPVSKNFSTASMLSENETQTLSSKLAGSSSWQTINSVVNIANPGDYNLVFMWRNDNSGGDNPPAAIDNVSISAYTCGNVSNLVSSNVISDGFTLDWTPSSKNETEWEVFVSNSATSNDTTFLTTTHPVNITGLNPNTYYTAKVRAACSNTDFGAWQSLNVSTACTEITTLPYLEDFSSFQNGTFPSCWRLWNAGNARISNGSLFFAANIVSTNIFNVPGVPLNRLKVQFDAKSDYSNFELIVGTAAQFGSNIVHCDTVLVTPEFKRYTVYLDNCTDSVGEIVFSSITPIDGIYYIDNVEVTQLPLCVEPVDVRFVDIAGSSATLSWRDLCGASSWEIAWGESGTDVDSLSPVQHNATTYQIIGLADRTDYIVYIRTNCGEDGYSEWVNVPFRTDVNPAVLPYSCGFEADDEETTAWDIVQRNGNNTLAVGSATSYSGSQSLYVTNDNGTSYNYSTSNQSFVYAKRSFSVGSGPKEFSFAWKGVGEGVYDKGRVFLIPSAYFNSIENITIDDFGYNSTAPAGWIELDSAKTLSESVNWNVQTYPIDFSSPENVTVLILWRNDSYGGENPPLAIDDIRFDIRKECHKPTDIAATNLLPNSVDLEWQGHNALTYTVVVTTESVNPDTVVDDTPENVVLYEEDLNSNTINLDHSLVNPNTTYYVYVQSDCNSADSLPSDWSDEFVFTTPTSCPPVVDIAAFSVDTTSFGVSWTGVTPLSSWQVAYGIKPFDVSTANWIDVDSTTYMLTNLTPSTVYDVYVRTICTDNDTSSVEKISQSTLTPPLVPPFSIDFENEAINNAWGFANEANGWYIGTATNNGGSNALYISNDNGTNNSYTMTAQSQSFAYLPIAIGNEAYAISYDYNVMGEFNCDYARVFLAPINEDFSGVYISTDASTTPTGWIAIDNGALIRGTDWSSDTNNINVPVAGNYLLVFAWKNDASGGNNPPIAIDNIVVSKKSCYLENVESIASTTTSITVNATTDCSTAEIKVMDINNNVLKDTISTLPCTVDGLKPSTAYIFQLRGICDSVNTTNWTPGVVLRTDCGAVTIDSASPFVENFENYNYYQMPNCWTALSNDEQQVGYPRVGSSGVNNSQSLTMYSSTNPDFYCFAVTPELVGTPLSQTQVTFYLKQDALVPFEIGVMTDPQDTTTFVRVGSYTCSSANVYEEVSLPLSNYNGSGHYVAFRCYTSGSNPVYVNIDDVLIETLGSCIKPTVAVANGTNAIDINITPAIATDSVWEVIVASVNDTIYHDTVTTTTLSVPCDALTTYYIYVRTVCGSNDYSAWTTRSISTPCAVMMLPFSEDFSGTVPPNSCWGKYWGTLASHWNSPTVYPMLYPSDGWVSGVAGNGLPTSHAAVAPYGADSRWLVTPEIHIETAATLTFDLAYTGAKTGNTTNDRFMVLVSTDGGATWPYSGIAAEWDNTGSVRMFDYMSATGENVSVDLNYPKQNVRLAFYLETNDGDANTYVHIDNILVEETDKVVVEYSDTICENNAYNNYGFNIGVADLTVGVENFFSRTVNDTIYVLGLMVNRGYTETENVTVCASALPYLWNGQTLTAAGTYTHTVTPTDGCDSVFTLVLTVENVITETIYHAVCDNELPYAWNGQDLTTTGTYSYTTTASNGCDSVVTLDFVVNQTYNDTVTMVINDTALPYFWNGMEIAHAGDYTFNGTSVSGCDSVVTLILTVSVGLDYVEDGMFAITPNPVRRGGSVRLDVALNEAERVGAVVEVFASNGKLVCRLVPKEQPMFITMPQEDGLYVIRLTTGTGRTMYGKVVVK